MEYTDLVDSLLTASNKQAAIHRRNLIEAEILAAVLRNNPEGFKDGYITIAKIVHDNLNLYLNTFELRKGN